MTKEELKNKYSAFISEISEILGLGKPIDIFKLCATTDLFFQPLENRIADLEKENAELDCQKNRNKSCYSCANATERCFRNEIGCPCEKYKSYKEEIAELKAYNEKLLDGDIEKHNKIVELQNRNGELAGQKASLERWLGEAKEIIKRLICGLPPLKNKI